MWAILAIIILGILLMLILRNERQKEILHQQEKERRQERARQEEYDRVEKLIQAGTPEFPLIKAKERLGLDEPASAYRCMTECTNIYGSSGKFELRLNRCWDMSEAAWLVRAEIWFIYPEMNINQKIYEDDYYLFKGMLLGESTQIFTYTDDPDEVGSGLFYILYKYVEVDGELVKVRGSSSSGPDLYIRINNPFIQKGK